jgi:phosphoribosylaminoimidazole carboxylase (NCAIR synthetase)
LPAASRSTRPWPPWRPARTGWPRRRSFRSWGCGRPRTCPSRRGRSTDEALRRVGLPAVLKTRRLGYDGKGQALLRSSAGGQRGLGGPARRAAHPGGLRRFLS